MNFVSKSYISEYTIIIQKIKVTPIRGYFLIPYTEKKNINKGVSGIRKYVIVRAKKKKNIFFLWVSLSDEMKSGASMIRFAQAGRLPCKFHARYVYRAKNALPAIRKNGMDKNK